jgi:mannitol/fructose-specific phosphotransferase system IIA component (Ntr-type)
MLRTGTQTVIATAMVKIVDYTAEPLLVPALQATDRPGVYNELAERFHQRGCIGEVVAFVRELRAPDGVFHPNTDHSVVFAWARGGFAYKTLFALGKSAAGVSFGPGPQNNVHLVFIIAAPTTKTCVDLLTVLAKMIYDHEPHVKLLSAKTSQEMLAVLAAQPQPTPQVQLGLFHR